MIIGASFGSKVKPEACNWRLFTGWSFLKSSPQTHWSWKLPEMLSQWTGTGRTGLQSSRSISEKLVRILFLISQRSCLFLYLILPLSSSQFHQILLLCQISLHDTTARSYLPPPEEKTNSINILPSEQYTDLPPLLHQPVGGLLDTGHHPAHEDWLRAEDPADGPPVHQVPQEVGLEIIWWGNVDE